MHTRPQPVTITVVLLALLSLLNFISPLLPTDYPTIVLFLGGALGVVGLLAAAGLWMLRRWGLLLTIIVSVLNIVLAAPGIAVESHATGKLLAGVTAVGFALIIVLVMRPNSRQGFRTFLSFREDFRLLKSTSMSNTSTAGSSFVKTAGLLCLVGAVIGVISGLVTAFIPPAVSSDWYSYPYTPTGFLVAELVFILNHVLLLVGILGLARSGVAGTSLLGRVGLWISVVGMAALTVCEVGAMTLARSPYPSPRTDLLDTSFGVASILIGVGLTLAGVAVARASEWTGWQRFVALICGVAVFVIVIPGIFGPFLAGRLVIVVWMLMFAALGWALYSQARIPEVEPAPATATDQHLTDT